MASSASCDAEKMAHFTYIWKIESAPGRAKLKSPVFTVPSMEMTKWKLVMTNWIFGIVPSVRIFIERNEEDDGPESIEVDLELAFLDVSGSSLTEKSGSGHFRKTTKSEEYEFFDDAIMVKRGDWFFPKDLLTIRCRLWRKGTEISKSEVCFATTRFDKRRASFVWAIKRFNSLKLEDKRKRFVDFGCEQLVFELSLDETLDDQCILVHLETHTLKNPFQICSETALLNAEGVISRKLQSHTYIDIHGITVGLCQLGRTEAAAFLSDDVLILQCDLILISQLPLWSRIDDYKLMDHPNSTMVQRDKNETNFDEITGTAVCPFKGIVHTFKEDGILSDVSLRAGTKSFNVHKLILSSRSPVFRAMFTEDMREKTSKCIDIPDMEADTLGRLLAYIYGDTLQDLTWETAANLYEAADEYAILDLKEKCSSVLKSNTSESNVCKILVIADLHQDESLKKSVQQFMQDNSEILNSGVWKDFRKEHTDLPFETTDKIIFNLKSSRS